MGFFFEKKMCVLNSGKWGVLLWGGKKIIIISIIKENKESIRKRIPEKEKIEQKITQENHTK